MKINKYNYVWKLWVYYGSLYGYEHECTYDTLKEAKIDAKAYRENCTYPVKITYARELNPDYIAN